MAKDFPEYVFAVSDEEDYSSEIKDLGLLESGEDVNAAILDEGGKKYAMEPEEFDSDVLREFVLAFKKGTVSKVGFSKLCCLPFQEFFPGVMAPVNSLFYKPKMLLWLLSVSWSFIFETTILNHGSVLCGWTAIKRGGVLGNCKTNCCPYFTRLLGQKVTSFN